MACTLPSASMLESYASSPLTCLSFQSRKLLN